MDDKRYELAQRLIDLALCCINQAVKLANAPNDQTNLETDHARPVKGVAEGSAAAPEDESFLRSMRNYEGT